MFRDSNERLQGAGPNRRRSVRRFGKLTLARALHRSGLLTFLARRSNELTVERRHGSVVPVVRRSISPKFGILCYHRIGTEGVPYHSQLAPAVFERQVAYLSQSYRVVSLTQLSEELSASADVPPTLAVTFDDGYQDVYTYAFPILRKYAIPATIYLIGQAMRDGTVPWYDRVFAALVQCPEQKITLRLNQSVVFELDSHGSRLAAAWQIVCYLRSVPDAERRRWCHDFDAIMSVREEILKNRMLSWAQVCEMQAQGISFGAHTMTHPSVAQLSSGDLRAELLESKLLLESRLGSVVNHFAFPFGKLQDCSVAAEEYLRRCGFRTAVTTSEGFNTPRTNPLRLNRLQVGGERSLSFFAFELARLFLEEPSRANDFPEGHITAHAPVRQAASSEVTAQR